MELIYYIKHTIKFTNHLFLSINNSRIIGNMREQNFCFPEQQRACLTITPSLYDRRALDCTAPLPLLTSLMHLSLMTSSSQRVREALSVDGGLERLTHILETTSRSDYPDRRSAWRWILAYHCLVNVGVRGSEQIRARVERSGGVRVIIHVLESYLKTLESVRMAREPAARNAIPFSAVNLPVAANTNAATAATTTAADTQTNVAAQGVVPMEVEETSRIDVSANVAASAAAARVAAGMTTTNDDLNMSANPATSLLNMDAAGIRRLPSWAANIIATRVQQVAHWTEPSTTAHKLATAPLAQDESDATHQLYNIINGLIEQVDSTSTPTHDINTNPFGHSTRHTSSLADSLDEPPFREEDILLALQLLAYLSKHPSIRDRLHANYPINVFTLVERFCARYHSNTIHLWAGVVMRNGCRKDDTRGGLRRCAYLHCGRWESRPHEFAKCRRCRKAKYCSKQCQSHAWADGHRYWCVPRQPTGTSNNGTGANNATNPSTTIINTGDATNANNAMATTTTTVTTTTTTAAESLFPTITTTTTTTTTTAAANAATAMVANPAVGIMAPLNRRAPHPVIDIGLPAMPPTIDTTPIPTDTTLTTAPDNNAIAANTLFSQVVGVGTNNPTTHATNTTGMSTTDTTSLIIPRSNQSTMQSATSLPSSSNSTATTSSTSSPTTTDNLSTNTLPLVDGMVTMHHHHGHIINTSRSSSTITSTTNNNNSHRSTITNTTTVPTVTTTTTSNANAANNVINTDDDDEDDLMEAQSTRVDVTSHVTSLTTDHRTSAVMAATTGTSSSIHATHGDLSADDELSTTERSAFHTSAISLS
jgi:hypothetical protein